MWILFIVTLFSNSIGIFGNPIVSLNCTKNEGNCENVSCAAVKVLAPKSDKTGEYFYIHVSDFENVVGNKNWDGKQFEIIQDGSQYWVGKIKVWKTDTISVAVGRRNYASAEGDWVAGDTIRLQSCKTDSEEQISAKFSDIQSLNEIKLSENSTSNPIKEKVKDIRLPNHLLPHRYQVNLVPFIIPDNFTIKGFVSITLEATLSGPTNITLHTAETNIAHKSVIVEEVSSLDSNAMKIREINITSYKFDNQREFYIIELNEPIVKGNIYKVSMEFVSTLREELLGFFRSSYQNEDGETEYYAMTQFQVTDARRAFPCLDEPEMKAKFDVKLGRMKNMTSLSNMPITKMGEAMEGTEDFVWDHFEESVPMSTYLVAFIVSRLEYEQALPTGNNVTFRIWARKAALDQVAYAKDIGVKMLQHFETYFNVPYPLPKQDLMALPAFQGAMENWGLINYQESRLLYKDGISTASSKQSIAVTISHELSHQWFGNLVSPKWWNDLWLNEGFATYVAYLGVEAVQPEMKFLEQFVSGVYGMHEVFSLDALATSHPISTPVQHPDEINEIFDKISYVKGASIIRMMSHFLTENTFRSGLTNYLKKFAFKAAGQDDLWYSLTTQAHADNTVSSNITVKEIMDTWTLQTGFPVLSVNRDYDGNKAELEQKRFLLSSTQSTDTHDYKWWIPITFTKPGGNFDNTYNKIWMKKSENRKVIEGLPDQNEAVIFNIQQTGYYRVNYDENNWKLIIKQLKEDHTTIHVVNRAQIIDDALNLARAGLLKYQIALDVTSYLHKENEYIPWEAALSGLQYLDVMLKQTTAYGDFKRYMRTLIDPLYYKIGYQMQPTDEHLDIYLRKLAVNWACKLGNPECKREAASHFSEWMEKINPDQQNQNPIDVNLRSSVYCNAIANGGQTEWDFGWQRYTKSNVATEKELLLEALSCTQKLVLINRFMNMSFVEDSEINRGDVPKVFANIGKNSVARDAAFDFVSDNWETVVSFYGSYGLSKLMENMLNNRNTQSSLDKIKTFKEEKDETLRTSRRLIEQSIEKTETNIAWMETNYENIRNWLFKQK